MLSKVCAFNRHHSPVRCNYRTISQTRNLTHSSSWSWLLFSHLHLEGGGTPVLSSAELCFAGPREPGGVPVGHQRAPPARQGSCHETQEAPRPQAKPTRGRPALRPITRCAGAPRHLAPRLRQRSFPAWRLRSCGAALPSASPYSGHQSEPTGACSLDMALRRSSFPRP